jgi:parvulin-like peptidyl-prolyl isomerase
MAGAIAGHYVCSSVPCRNAVGRWCHRGPLLALVEGVGIYQCDIDRAQHEWNDRDPASTDEIEAAQALPTGGTVIANFRAARLGRDEHVSNELIDRQFELTRFQFQPNAWLTALRSDGLYPWSLRHEIARNLRAQSWIEKRIRPALAVRPEECAAYYEAHSALFMQPFRIRASHIFFAAPPGSSAELIESKRLAAQAIVHRIANREKFSELVVNSEDEASKKRGGDLNFFSEARVPGDFWAALRGIKAGEPARIIRTALGFHIVQVTDSRPVRQISPEEARPGILVTLENEKRATAVEILVPELARAGANLQIP